MRFFIAVAALAFVAVSSAEDRFVCACTDDYRPVCGSNGKTYANLCGLNCDKHNAPGLSMVYQGECQKFQRDPCMCTREYNPVCGSDGKTYGNLCTFRCEQATHNSGLTLAHHGQCEVEAKVVPCVCTYEYNPVCGSDGQTYGNPCSFNCAAKSTNGLTIAHYGECQVEAKAEVPCICTADYRPVCGSDGKTYGNPCMLSCSAKSANGLMKVYDGECGKPFQNEPCACTREYYPICGNDGKTYGNMCTFKCQQKQTPALAIVHQGRPCNQMTNFAAARPVCKCTKEYNPVCGSDGKTYSNPCTLRCEQATHNSALTMSHMGGC